VVMQEGFLTSIHQRFINGSLNPALMVPTMQTMINASRMYPPKRVGQRMCAQEE
jgi:hypothetical protein